MKKIKKIFTLDQLAKTLFVFSLGVLLFCYGFFVNRNQIFPYKLLKQANDRFQEIFIKNYYRKTNYVENIPIFNESAAFLGPTMITSIAQNKLLSIKIIDMEGNSLHEWDIDWFEIWPDATHIPKERLPKSRPGTHIHGSVILENGDILFNFENLGMVRLDVCGNVKWRLPYRTHHSIYLDEYDNLWVSGRKYYDQPLPNFPNHIPPIDEPIVLKISLDGKILNEISILELLKENGFEGLLILSSLQGAGRKPPTVSGDTMHLNDVETFPSYLKEGAFQAGDIMVSLRNINTVLIFRESDHKITHISVGQSVRQHDPDFIDGNTISIFDNNNITPKEYGQSRILIKSFADDRSYTYYIGDEENPFFTSVLGKHQWLPNGNLLITESMKGRAFEIDKNGNIVWEFINLVGNGYVGVVEEAHRLPTKYSRDFFYEMLQECNSTVSK
jgi:hypothetical protein